MRRALQATLAFWALGCVKPPQARRIPPPPRPPPSSAGTWYWQSRAVNAQGDLQIEEEEWVLEVSGISVSGYYDRSVTFLSMDGRPFRCNGDLTFSRRARYELEGQVKGADLALRETDYAVEPGPCEHGMRALDRYAGRVGEDVLILKWEGGEQRLERSRPDAQREATPDLRGTWEWENRMVDANGDRRVEMEHWSIDHDGEDLHGSYESVVTFTSGSGPYACNGAPEYRLRARFEFMGHLDGNRIRIKETSYSVDPGPCEPGMRRLGSYSGSVKDAWLVLDWGAGRQTLRRR